VSMSLLVPSSIHLLGQSMFMQPDLPCEYAVTDSGYSPLMRLFLHTLMRHYTATSQQPTPTSKTATRIRSSPHICPILFMQGISIYLYLGTLAARSFMTRQLQGDPPIRRSCVDRLLTKPAARRRAPVRQKGKSSRVPTSRGFANTGSETGPRTSLIGLASRVPHESLVDASTGGPSPAIKFTSTARLRLKICWLQPCRVSGRELGLGLPGANDRMQGRVVSVRRSVPFARRKKKSLEWP